MQYNICVNVREMFCVFPVQPKTTTHNSDVLHFFLGQRHRAVPISIHQLHCEGLTQAAVLQLQCQL